MFWSIYFFEYTPGIFSEILHSLRTEAVEDREVTFNQIKGLYIKFPLLRIPKTPSNKIYHAYFCPPEPDTLCQNLMVDPVLDHWEFFFDPKISKMKSLDFFPVFLTNRVLPNQAKS